VWDLLTDTHTRLTAPLSRTTRVSRYQKGKTSLDFTEARDSEWQWHQLGHMQVCTLLQIDNHTSTPPLCFYRPDALPATQPTASKHLRQIPPYRQSDQNLRGPHVARQQLSINICCPRPTSAEEPPARRCCRRSTGQTADKRTPNRYVDPAPHTMRAAPANKTMTVKLK